MAVGWLTLSPKTMYGAPQTLKERSLGGIAVMASLAIPMPAFFAPAWATPVAKLWYAPGFEKAVTKALTETPNPKGACIYDDGQNMFVTSIEQLDVERMIEKSVQDKAPRLRFNSRQRDPHFRVYAGNQIYYWSFQTKNSTLFGAIGGCLPEQANSYAKLSGGHHKHTALPSKSGAA